MDNCGHRPTIYVYGFRELPSVWRGACLDLQAGEWEWKDETTTDSMRGWEPVFECCGERECRDRAMEALGARTRPDTRYAIDVAPARAGDL